MGAKNSKASESKLSVFERKTVTTFLESKGNKSHLFDSNGIQTMWQDMLVPDLLVTYSDFLLKQIPPSSSKSSHINLEQFVTLYSDLARGNDEEKAACLAAVLSPPQYKKQHHVSYSGLCKYLSDLLESYFKTCKLYKDPHYTSWTQMNDYDRAVIEVVVTGVCNDLKKMDDSVKFNDLEHWLKQSSMVAELHVNMIGYLYRGITVDASSSIVPLANFPTPKTTTILNVSQVVYLSSLIPFENRADWRFLFSTSTHGESFSKLISCITDQGPLLLVVESDDLYKFGGFISQNINLGPRWVGTSDSFLFRLIPNTEVFIPTGYNKHFVYFNSNQTSLPNGLGMGGQFGYWGLWVDAHFGNGECSDTCTTYKNYNMIASKKKFRVINLEVWGLGEPPLSPEQRGERGGKGKSVLDKDAAATHLLEMAGHEIHSKGFRKSE